MDKYEEQFRYIMKDVLIEKFGGDEQKFSEWVNVKMIGVRGIMRDYGEHGNEWWMSDDTDLKVFFQLREGRILMDQKQFACEISKLLGRTVTQDTLDSITDNELEKLLKVSEKINISKGNGGLIKTIRQSTPVLDFEKNGYLGDFIR